MKSILQGESKYRGQSFSLYFYSFSFFRDKHFVLILSLMLKPNRTREFRNDSRVEQAHE